MAVATLQTRTKSLYARTGRTQGGSRMRIYGQRSRRCGSRGIWRGREGSRKRERRNSLLRRRGDGRGPRGVSRVGGGLRGLVEGGEEGGEGMGGGIEDRRDPCDVRVFSSGFSAALGSEGSIYSMQRACKVDGSIKEEHISTWNELLSCLSICKTRVVFSHIADTLCQPYRHAE